jgi:D-alanyl-lipoteichoic acid acyltransferase DltB (MBOAT superfamily)
MAWEALLQMRLVALVSISVASLLMGLYYTLLAYGALLAAMMVWHDLQKPYKDLCLQQLQTLAYLVLLTNVALGIVVVTAAVRPGPRPAFTLQMQPNAAAVGALQCPYQQGSDPDLSAT